MKLFRISQDVNDEYDTYDSAIVAAQTKKEAQHTPIGHDNSYEWASPADVNVEYLGMAKRGTKKGVILTSFNAG